MKQWTFTLLMMLGMSLTGSEWTNSELMAGQVHLDVSMANPQLLAKKKQNTFMKVGLTGFKIPKKAGRAPVNVAIVLDKSGSMTGQKIAKAKEAAIAAICRLNKNDIVSIVTYESTVQVVVPATKLTDKKSVIAKIRQIQASGSTALFAGVSKGAAEIRKFFDKNRVNRIILLSDGLANVGPKSPSELGKLGASLMKEGISVTTMGLGLGYNEDLMAQLALKSGGNHSFIEDAGNLVALFNHEFDDVLSVVAQEVVVDMRLAKGVRPVKTMNVDSEINGQQVIVRFNQLYSEQERYLLLELEVPAGNVGDIRSIATVKVSYANLHTKNTDRLSSTVQVRFTKSAAAVEKNANTKVKVACVLQIANGKNKLAVTLRDQGKIKEAQEVLRGNAKYLKKKGYQYGDSKLLQRGVANGIQAEGAGPPESSGGGPGDSKSGDAKWAATRKQMREHQNQGATNQKYYVPPKPPAKK